jgi:NTP-dependent ternary system trypsin peptidase co-occuring protein
MAADVPTYLAAPVADGEVLVEVTSQEAGLVPASVPEMRERLTAGIVEQLGRVRTFATEVLAQLRSSVDPPAKVAVEFGPKLTAKAGLVKAESTSEAHLTVALEWNRLRPGSTEG